MKEKIENKIFIIRNQKVMLDRDLAALYDVQTFRLNEAVKRNMDRFPNDFMFKLNDNELKELIANCDRLKNLKHSSSNPYAFTEQGVAMLSSVLKSDRAIAINIQIMRTFVELRNSKLLQTSTSVEIAEVKKMLLMHIENNDSKFEKYDKTIGQIINVLNNLIEKPKETKQVGFKAD